MKKLAVAAVVLFLVACPKPGPSPEPPGPIGGIIDCAEKAVRDVAINLLPAVETALISGQWEAELLALVVRFGESAVDCAVHQVSGEASHDVQSARTDSLARARVDHGKAWLAKRGVNFK